MPTPTTAEFQQRNWESQLLISRAAEEHSPVALFAMFSGGHDSLVNTHVTAQHPAFTAVVHLNTGIGIEETRDFVRATCARQGWPLIEREPPRMTYEDICRLGGMPGGLRGHDVTFHRLKKEALEILIQEYKRHKNDRVLLSSGVRRAESARRMRIHPDPINRTGVKVWVNPISTWTARDVNRYMEAYGLERNPVVDNLHRSGECLCGALAHPDELKLIEYHYPPVAARIHALERECFDAGFKHKWGSIRPPKADPSQGRFDDLCSSCVLRWDEQETELVIA